MPYVLAKVFISYRYCVAKKHSATRKA